MLWGTQNMSKYIKFIIAFVMLVAAALLVYFIEKSRSYDIKDTTFSIDVKYKGLMNARDFAIDENNNFYIAYKEKIQFIDSSGKSFDIIKDSNYDINALTYKKGKLYFTSGTKVIMCDLIGKNTKDIVVNLPNFGDNKESLITIINDKLYISIGSATNAGVVGKDNEWINNFPYNYDISPIDLILTGKNFGNEKTGAFTMYGTKSISAQVIPKHEPGNASILEYDISTGKCTTFASGIRNVKGMDFSCEGALIVTLGGMEPVGLRPIFGDSDYIYEIDKGKWYGWPDYSGGDPVTSPKFKGDKKSSVDFILQKHPDSMPPAPMYQHKSLGTLSVLAIDRQSILGLKDSIYFYDNGENCLYEFANKKAVNKKVDFSSKHKIVSMHFSSECLNLLDGEKGCIYSLKVQKDSHSISVRKDIIFYLIGIIIIIIVKILWNSNSK